MAEHKVWKFRVPMGEVHGPGSTVTMPAGAEIVSVGTQGVEVFVWALVDPDAPKVGRRLGFFATGSPLPEGWVHVGTAHVPGPNPTLEGSNYVWHVFEEGER